MSTVGNQVRERLDLPGSTEPAEPQLRLISTILREHTLHERSLGLLQVRVLDAVLLDQRVEISEEFTDGALFFASRRKSHRRLGHEFPICTRHLGTT